MTELVGHLTYTEMVFFLLRNRVPTPAETRVLDACLVILMEHGLTLNTMVARFVASAVPDQMQVAMGASLMTIGDTFMGTMEGCARILQAGVAVRWRPARLLRRGGGEASCREEGGAGLRSSLPQAG